MRKTIAVIMSVLFQAGLVAPLFAAEGAVRLEKIIATKDSVLIKTAAPVQYDTFSAKEPAKIVIELLNSELNSGLEKVVPVKGAGRFIRAVTVEQYQVKPIKICRVTLELNRNAAYNAVAKGNAVAVFLSDAPAEPRKAAEVQYGAGASKASFVDIMQNLPQDKINIDYDTADVRTVLSSMAEQVGFNIIFAEDVAGDVTMRLKNVPFKEAFCTILTVNSLNAQQMGNNILRVTTAQTVKSENATAAMVTRVFPLHYMRADEMKVLIGDVITAEGRKGKVTSNDPHNMLMVTDVPSGLDSIERLISQLDKRPVQVLIETKLVEVHLTDSLTLGIDWNAYGADQSTIGSQTGLNFYGSGDVQNQAYTGVTTTGLAYPYTTGNNIYTPLSNKTDEGGTGVNFPSVADEITGGAFRFGRIAGNMFLDVTINATAQKGKAKVLSDPKVATVNNKTAKINITTQIPYTTSETTNTNPTVTTTKVTYIDTGITLEVTPLVNDDGRITMKIKPTVSQKATSVAEATGGAPGVDTRSVETTIITRDGETIVIGGLIYDSDSNVLYKVPLLGDIPLLGWFFKKKVDARSRIELLIFVTPKIVAS
ncbi:MAG: type IV pilus secretin PilQ [Elusimicrobiaceae bacterium]|nr:type IV pilus secretin PilQ [Elusimicrobiaceae bacterium]